MASLPRVFISYSHKDEKWKDRILNHLGVLQSDGHLDVWNDRRIVAGSNWEQEIESALNQADAALLLISANFLNSRFILGKEVPLLLQRRANEGLPVIPVIIRSCPWSKVSWLASIQCRPKEGKALASFTGDERNQELTKIAIEICDLLHIKTKPAPILEFKRKTHHIHHKGNPDNLWTAEDCYQEILPSTLDNFEDEDFFDRPAPLKFGRSKPYIRIICPVCGNTTAVNALDGAGCTSNRCDYCEADIWVRTDEEGCLVDISAEVQTGDYTVNWLSSATKLFTQLTSRRENRLNGCCPYCNEIFYFNASNQATILKFKCIGNNCNANIQVKTNRKQVIDITAVGKKDRNWFLRYE